MPQFTLTLAMGKKAENIVQASGSSVGADTVRVNFDVTKMSKEQALLMLGEVAREVEEGPWPRA